MLFEFTQQKFRRGTIENVVENKYIGGTMNGRASRQTTRQMHQPRIVFVALFVAVGFVGAFGQRAFDKRQTIHT